MAGPKSPAKSEDLDKKRKDIAKLVERHDLTSDRVWPKLAALSSATQVEAVEVDPEGIVIVGDRFQGVMNVYLKLEYAADAQPEETFITSDSVLGKFEGYLKGGKPVLDAVSVETSQFYDEVPSS